MIDSIRTLAALRVRGRPAVAGAVFLGLFLLSLVLFLAPSPGRVRRVLFFPSTTTREAPGKPARLIAEARLLPRHRNTDRDARELVEAVLLGPASHGAAPLFPAATTVRMLVERRGVLYVDVSAQAAIPDAAALVTLGDAAAALKRAVRFNFPGIREVAFTVDGQVPRPTGAGKN